MLPFKDSIYHPKYSYLSAPPLKDEECLQNLLLPSFFLSFQWFVMSINCILTLWCICLMIKVICFDSSQTRNLQCLSIPVILTFDIHFLRKMWGDVTNVMSNQHSPKCFLYLTLRLFTFLKIYQIVGLESEMFLLFPLLVIIPARYLFDYLASISNSKVDIVSIYTNIHTTIHVVWKC